MSCSWNVLVKAIQTCCHFMWINGTRNSELVQVFCHYFYLLISCELTYMIYIYIYDHMKYELWLDCYLHIYTQAWSLYTLRPGDAYTIVGEMGLALVTLMAYASPSHWLQESLMTGVSSIRTLGTKFREMLKFPFISANAKIIIEPGTSSVFSVRFLVISVWECRDGRKLKITHLGRHWRAFKGTAHLTQQSFWMATFSAGLKIFKIAFEDVVDNSWEIPTAPFSATN